MALWVEKRNLFAGNCENELKVTSAVIFVILSVILTTVIHASPTNAKSFNLTELESQIKGDSILKNETEALIRKILAKREELKSILIAPSNQEILQASAASQLLQQQVASSESQQLTSPIQQARQGQLTDKQTQNFGQMMGSFMNTIGLSMRRMWDFFANALKMMRSMYSKVVG